MVAMNTVRPCTIMKSRWKIESSRRLPRPGMANRNSTTTVPPSSEPMFRPMTVISVSELGLRQWRNRTYRSDRPFARADST